MSAKSTQGTPLPVRQQSPVAEIGCGPRRRSTRGRWRALTLTLVYIAFVAHFVHWRLAGRTLSPVEPSEAMQTLEQGLLNAGFVLFALAILSTLGLGRWFCGWLCHMIALQDLCTWLLKKIRVRPKPFRSRLLAFVPLLAALYMFVWPSVRRIWLGAPAPALIRHFTTEDYWATFPGVGISLLTFFVCGFLIVWLLGNKGFCTYACPYGGFFGVADRVAPGKIRVTEDCDGCGHCTAACTSNVRVHEQVRDFGMVVDPGCMKCTDCVSVCPKNALYFGFGKPSVIARRRLPSQPRRWDYTWPEELALAGCFLIALYAFRGLYDAIPFLLALGLGAIIAFLFVQAIRMVYSPSLRLQRLQMRFKGRLTRTGAAFGATTLLLAAFVAHAILVQYHAREGERLLNEAAAAQASNGGDSAVTTGAAEHSLRHLEWLRRYGLFATPRTEAQLGSLYLFLGQVDRSEPHLQRALELEPGYAAARHKWAELQARRGDMAGAIAELQRALNDGPGLADLRRDLVAALRRAARLPEAVTALETVVRRRPQDVAARLEWASLLAETGDRSRGIAEVRNLLAHHSDNAAAHFRLGLMLVDEGALAAALDELGRAVELDPQRTIPRLALARLALSAGREALALTQTAEAKELEPLNPDVLRLWAFALRETGRLQAAIDAAEAADPDDVHGSYALVFLHLAAGNRRAADVAYERALSQHPGLPHP